MTGSEGFQKWPEGQRQAAEQTESLASRLRGMTEADAIALAAGAGVEIVVRVRDGESHPIRTKLDPRRISLTIETDRVTSARVG